LKCKQQGNMILGSKQTWFDLLCHCRAAEMDNLGTLLLLSMLLSLLVPLFLVLV